MGCPSGYTTLDSYPRIPKKAILPWDYDGSRCRAKYNSEDEAAWFDYQEDASGCSHTPGSSGEICYLASCLNAKYLVYLNRVNANESSYFNCKN